MKEYSEDVVQQERKRLDSKIFELENEDHGNAEYGFLMGWSEALSRIQEDDSDTDEEVRIKIRSTCLVVGCKRKCPKLNFVDYGFKCKKCKTALERTCNRDFDFPNEYPNEWWGKELEKKIKEDLKERDLKIIKTINQE